MAQTTVTYCDDCGDVVEQTEGTSLQSPFGGEVKPYAAFTEVPFNVQSANAGESAVVCLDCIERQMEDGEEE